MREGEEAQKELTEAGETMTPEIRARLTKVVDAAREVARILAGHSRASVSPESPGNALGAPTVTEEVA